MNDGSSSTHPVVDELLRGALPTVLARNSSRMAFVRPSKASPEAVIAVEPIQEWEGVVEWVEDGEFGARLSDLSDSGEPEETEFSLSEVSEDDLALVAPGAVFYWTIAREINETKRLRHVTMLRFRRLPAGRSARRAEVDREAEWIAGRLRFGEQSASADTASA